MDLGDKVKALVEVELEKLIEAKSNDLVSLALAELAKAIPGQLDDVMIEAVKPMLLPVVKAELLKLVEQISKDV